MDRLLAARFDSAFVFVFGRRRAAVFDREPPRAWTTAGNDDPACGLAVARSDFAWSVSAIDKQGTNVLDFRGHTVANRPGLCLFVSARISADARSMDCIGRRFDRLLAGVCAVSFAATGFRLHASWRAERLAASDEWICRPLEQEQ